jgi:hypothetical protein
VDPTNSDVVVGTADLVTAASMFGSGVLKALRDTTIQAPVEAEFTLGDGEIEGWSISGQSMAAAVEREHELVEPSDDLLTAVSSHEVAVECDKVGVAEVKVRPPDPVLQMTLAQSNSRVGCPAVR